MRDYLFEIEDLPISPLVVNSLNYRLSDGERVARLAKGQGPLSGRATFSHWRSRRLWHPPMRNMSVAIQLFTSGATVAPKAAILLQSSLES